MQKKQKVTIAILIFLSLFGIFFNIKSESRETADSPPNAIARNYINKAILKINGIQYEDDIAEGTTVYDFMDKLRSKGKIVFTEKNYTGMGKFIITINGIAGSEQRNWIYYVNGKKAQTGVSNYKIKSGDVVSWKLEKFSY